MPERAAPPQRVQELAGGPLAAALDGGGAEALAQAGEQPLLPGLVERAGDDGHADAARS